MIILIVDSGSNFELTVPTKIQRYKSLNFIRKTWEHSFFQGDFIALDELIALIPKADLKPVVQSGMSMPDNYDAVIFLADPDTSFLKIGDKHYSPKTWRKYWYEKHASLYE